MAASVFTPIVNSQEEEIHYHSKPNERATFAASHDEDGRSAGDDAKRENGCATKCSPVKSALFRVRQWKGDAPREGRMCVYTCEAASGVAGPHLQLRNMVLVQAASSSYATAPSATTFSLSKHRPVTLSTHLKKATPGPAQRERMRRRAHLRASRNSATGRDSAQKRSSKVKKVQPSLMLTVMSRPRLPAGQRPGSVAVGRVWEKEGLREGTHGVGKGGRVPTGLSAWASGRRKRVRSRKVVARDIVRLGWVGGGCPGDRGRSECGRWLVGEGERMRPARGFYKAAERRGVAGYNKGGTRVFFCLQSVVE